MNFGNAAKLIASAFALCGFAIAVIAGMAAGNDATHVLGTAVVCMVICQGAGFAAGAIGERVVGEHVARYREAHPVPGEEADGRRSSPHEGRIS